MVVSSRRKPSKEMTCIAYQSASVRAFKKTNGSERATDSQRCKTRTASLFGHLLQFQGHSHIRRHKSVSPPRTSRKTALCLQQVTACQIRYRDTSVSRRRVNLCSSVYCTETCTQQRDTAVVDRQLAQVSNSWFYVCMVDIYSCGHN